MKSPMPFLQQLGRALMLPIAVLPVAGLMLRLGQPDLHLHLPFLSVAGEAIFSNLGLLFAVGVATGFARDGNGAAALAGVLCYLVSGKGAASFLVVPADIGAGLADPIRTTVEASWRAAAIGKFDVPVGIISGLVGGLFYNRFATIRLPDYLAFFGGRRFVPIVSGLAGLGIAAALGASYGVVDSAVDAMSHAVVGAGGFGLFVFGVLNRLLIVTGLHHILNNIAYFVVGDWHGKTGDLTRFFAGDPSAGGFMSGFFPVMMFGLPAACLAMYHEALPDRRKAAGGLLLSLALTSFLTGVTEPIEFSFMFLAPALYVIHALLTGLAEAIMNALGVKLGYGFSAGLFDYVLNYGKATKPLLLLPVGAAYAVLYYGIFRFTIRRFDLPTPGRERDAPVAAAPAAGGGRGAAFVAALGGADNLREVGACTTRLRLLVADQALVDEAALKALGARGVLRPSAQAVQVVLGPIADGVAMEMRGAMDRPVSAVVPVVEEAAAYVLSAHFVEALGGEANLVTASRHFGRLRVTLVDAALASDERLVALGARGVARPAVATLHVLLAEGAG